MTCETIQNRLLALPDPARPTDELRGHLAACPACRAVQAEIVRIEKQIVELPVPSSEGRKLAFLAELDATGPVIRTKPVAPSQWESGSFRPVTAWLQRADWRWVGGTAAAVLVAAVGGLWLSNRPKPPVIEAAEKPRHELLAKSVRHNVVLNQSRTPSARLSVFVEWSADIQAEACDMATVAAADEMNGLARQYEKAVHDGIRRQADLLKDGGGLPVAERQQALKEAMDKLTAAEVEARKSADHATAGAKPALVRIAKAAQDGRSALTLISQGKG